jgi:hypothetical protein
VAGASAFDGASAGFYDGRYRYYAFDGGFSSYRAPQANHTQPGATPRPPIRDMRMAPSMGGRGMRGIGRGRVNGGMGRR